MIFSDWNKYIYHKYVLYEKLNILFCNGIIHEKTLHTDVDKDERLFDHSICT